MPKSVCSLFLAIKNKSSFKSKTTFFFTHLLSYFAVRECVVYDVPYIYLLQNPQFVSSIPLPIHNMSHRKVHSQCTVPFLWEEIPGVPKSNFVHHSSTLPPPDSLPPSDDNSPKLSAYHEMNMIPLPPPCPLQSMHNYKRSSSFRGKLF